MTELPASESIEDFNQIDPGTLACFPQDRYPVDLYEWKEKPGILVHVYKCGQELNSKSRARFKELSEEERLFFSRRQIEEYTEVLSCNLDHAMADPNLTWEERAVLFIRELSMRQEALFRHPMAEELHTLQCLISELCSQLMEDNTRIGRLIHEVHRNLVPERRRVNASLIGLAVYMEMDKGKILVENLEKVALGFFVYDIGMSKISPMMLAKRQQLTPLEQRTVHEHPTRGHDILVRLGLTEAEIIEPALQHHERLDGSGYPKRLPGERLGRMGRIAAVADTYGAMVTETPQRKGFSPLEAAGELLKGTAKYDQVVSRTLVRFLQTVPS